MTFFFNTKYFAIYTGGNSALTSMVSHHSPTVHQQPLCSLLTEHVGLSPHFTHKDKEEKKTKLMKYIQSDF